MLCSWVFDWSSLTRSLDGVSQRSAAESVASSKYMGVWCGRHILIVNDGVVDWKEASRQPVLLLMLVALLCSKLFGTHSGIAVASLVVKN